MQCKCEITSLTESTEQTTVTERNSNEYLVMKELWTKHGGW